MLVLGPGEAGGGLRGRNLAAGGQARHLDAAHGARLDAGRRHHAQGERQLDVAGRRAGARGSGGVELQRGAQLIVHAGGGRAGDAQGQAGADHVLADLALAAVGGHEEPGEGGGQQQAFVNPALE